MGGKVGEGSRRCDKCPKAMRMAEGLELVLMIRDLWRVSLERPSFGKCSNVGFCVAGPEKQFYVEVNCSMYFRVHTKARLHIKSSAKY